MKKVVVDTDIIIDCLRIENGVLQKLFELQKEKKIELYLSSISILELFAGKSSQKTSSKLLRLIDLFRVIPLGQEMTQLGGELKRDHNLSIAIADLVIAATALSIRAQLATRNKRHYQAIPKLQFYPITSSAL